MRTNDFYSNELLRKGGRSENQHPYIPERNVNWRTRFELVIAFQSTILVVYIQPHQRQYVTDITMAKQLEPCCCWGFIEEYPTWRVGRLKEQLRATFQKLPPSLSPHVQAVSYEHVCYGIENRNKQQQQQRMSTWLLLSFLVQHIEIPGAKRPWLRTRCWKKPYSGSAQCGRLVAYVTGHHSLLGI